MTKRTLTISGMSCAACVTRVESALADTPGVESASVNLATNEATVAFDQDALPFEKLIQSVESAGYGVTAETTVLQVDGMSCAACVGRVESALTALPGVTSVTVNLATNEAAVEHLSVSTSDLSAAVERAGYTIRSSSDVSASEDETLIPKLIVSGGISIALMVLGTRGIRTNLDPALHATIALLITIPAQFWCGWPFLTGFWSALRHGSANMHSLIAVGTLSAFTYSLVVTIDGLVQGTSGQAHLYFDTATMIITFVLLGRVLEHRARNRTSDAIRSLMDLQPETARVIREGETIEVPVDQVLAGDLIHVRPGDRVPVDGRITQGQSSIDESLISGESMPVDKQVGDDVTGGSINHTGSFTFEATKVGADTALARIIDLVKQAQASRPPIQRLADRIAAVFVPIIFAIAGVTFLAWWLIDGSFSIAMVNAVAVLIISCPCALGLATPTAVLVGTGKAAELGLLIKHGEIIETAHRIRTIVLDKTGTLTHGRPVVTDIHPFEGQSENDLIGLAAALERNSEHPIGIAIVEEAERRGIDPGATETFEAVAGGGVRGRVDGRNVLLGTERFLRQEGVASDTASAEELQSAGRTAILVAIDGLYAGTIGVADQVKENARSVVAELKRSGIEVAMLTGDNTRTAEAVAKSLGLDLVVAEVRPEDKASRITALQQDRGIVAMVGDGINDAPALAQADVGIAIGTGTDVAIESADVALMSGDLKGISALISLSRRTMRIIRQNLFWAFAYNVLLVPVAAAGLLTPWGGPKLAAAAMAFSSVTVVTNALRLKRFHV